MEKNKEENLYIIQIPENLRQKHKTYNKKIDLLRHLLKKEPDLYETADYLGIREEDLKHIKRVTAEPLLVHKYTSKEYSFFYEILSDIHTENLNLFEKLYDEIIRKYIYFSEAQQIILNLILGVDLPKIITFEELEDHLGLTYEQISHILEEPVPNIYIEIEFNEDNNYIELQDYNSKLAPDYNFMKESFLLDVEDLLSNFSGKEELIIRYFFGLGKPEIPIDDIAEHLNLSSERVRQILTIRCIPKLRRLFYSIF